MTERACEPLAASRDIDDANGVREALREGLSDLLVGKVQVDLKGGKGFGSRTLRCRSITGRQVGGKLGDLGRHQLPRAITNGRDTC